MKKIFLVLGTLFCIILSACTTDTSGYVYELTSESWATELEGGGKISLEFTDDTAVMMLENGGESTSIQGKYLADDEMFIIFMPEISRNYSFEYTPKGSTLDISYNNHTITLNRGN